MGIVSYLWRLVCGRNDGQGSKGGEVQAKTKTFQEISKVQRIGTTEAWHWETDATAEIEYLQPKQYPFIEWVELPIGEYHEVYRIRYGHNWIDLDLNLN